MHRDLWTDEFLDRCRDAGDPIADRIVAATLASAGGPDALRRLIQDPSYTADLPDEVRGLIARAAAPPAWTDPALLSRAERLFREHALLSLVALLCAGLPEMYLLKNAAQVLALSLGDARLVNRSILKSAQVMIDVMGPDGLSAGGDGARSLLRVRLIHAAIRHLVLAPPGARRGHERALLGGERFARARWDASFGVPVNQEDLAFALLCHSFVVWRSLLILGVELSDEDEVAWLHCWRVAGHLLGLDEQLSPLNPFEARLLFDRIATRQRGDCPESRALASALLSCLEDVVAGPPLLDRLPRMMVRHLLGGEWADHLGIAPLGVVERAALLPLVSGIGLVEHAQDDASTLGEVAHLLRERFGRALLHGLARTTRDRVHEPLRTPPDLGPAWQM